MKRVRESIYTNPIRPTFFGKVTGSIERGNSTFKRAWWRVEDGMQRRASQPAPPTAHASAADYPFSAGRSVFFHGRGAFEKVVGPPACTFGGDGVGCRAQEISIRREWDRGDGGILVELSRCGQTLGMDPRGMSMNQCRCVFLGLDAHLPSWPINWAECRSNARQQPKSQPPRAHPLFNETHELSPLGFGVLDDKRLTIISFSGVVDTPLREPRRGLASDPLPASRQLPNKIP